MSEKVKEGVSEKVRREGRREGEGKEREEGGRGSCPSYQSIHPVLTAV